MKKSAPLTYRQRARRLAGIGLGAILALLLFNFPPSLAIGQEPANVNPTRVKSAFLRNFAHYVIWPTLAFTDEHSAWRICILGNDPLGETLENSLEGRKEQGRVFEVFRADRLATLPSCQIVYVVYKDSEKRRAALAALQKQPILTVGDAPEFLQEGGVIRFQVAERVQFSVNLDQARSASLRIQSKMLEVAQEVMENGVVRRRR